MHAALHIAYLSRNFQVVSELLEQGVSTTVRDDAGKTASQMLEQGRLVRRRLVSSQLRSVCDNQSVVFVYVPSAFASGSLVVGCLYLRPWRGDRITRWP